MNHLEGNGGDQSFTWIALSLHKRCCRDVPFIVEMFRS
jgi:hypothetical protein